MEAWGVDGCKAGWFYVCLAPGRSEFGVAPTLLDVARQSATNTAIFVDIPIGLLDAGASERVCDVEARRVLSPARASSVFPTPCRAAVYASSYEEAQGRNRAALGKGLSKQSWAISPKIREVDELLSREPQYRGRIREIHPEVCFWGLAGAPMVHAKKTRLGFKERLSVLQRHVPDASALAGAAFLEHGGFEAGRDDVLDALVAALCASRHEACLTLPDTPLKDACGLAMEMVYWPARAT